MKRIITILALGLALASVSFGQKKISQRCPGSSSNAEVSISKQGDVAITKCTGRTLTIDGFAYAPAPNVLRYVVKIRQISTQAPSILATLFNNTGATLSFTYNGVGDYTATLSSPIMTTNKTRVVMPGPFVSNVYGGSLCRAYSYTTSGFSINCVKLDGSASQEMGNTATSVDTLVIEVYP